MPKNSEILKLILEKIKDIFVTEHLGYDPSKEIEEAKRLAKEFPEILEMLENL
jgi:hypothetical protein